MQARTESPEFLNRRYTYFMRGVCMLLIVFAHTANEFPLLLQEWHLGSIYLLGRYATGIFFFLSGYGLTLSLSRSDVGRTYIVRHLRNLLLPYLIFWLFYLAAGLLAGHFATRSPLLKEFLSLKIPNVDTWFLRTILAIYLIYMMAARFAKPHAATIVSTTVVAYTILAASLGIDGWWWNTILCFPLGILFARRPKLSQIRCTPLVPVALLVLLVTFQRFVPLHFFEETCPPVVCCLIFAYLSTKVKVSQKKSVMVFIGRGSLYMYLMEAIPGHYIDSADIGFPLYVAGCILITILLTYAGKKLENLIP